MTDPRDSRANAGDLPPPSTYDALDGPRADLARAIPRRPRVSWWLGVVLAAMFAIVVLPAITADRWLGVLASVDHGAPASFTVRVPPFAGYDTATGHTGGGGVLLARGEVADRDLAETAAAIDASLPHGPVPYVAFLLLVGVLAGLFTHHTRRSTQGRLLRVQLVSLAVIVVAAIAVKVVTLTTSVSVLVIPVAIFAMVPTLVLDRVVGLATGTLAALVVTLLVPFDVGVAVMLMVQAGAAGLVIAERPKKLLRPVLTAGAVATVFTAATYPLMLYLTTGRLPLAELSDPLHSAWLASAIGPALATLVVVPLVPVYQLLVGEITHGKLVELEDLSNPLLKQIASKSPGTWQHSLMMANMAEIAANAIGANGRLVRVGAYYHDLGKSLQPKYFIENLEPGETSPHDKLPPEVSCDAIFAHVTEGIVSARRAGLHERVIDFMHMHHGNGVLEYFWGKTKEQGNPKNLSVEHFRYPGVPPQSRETAILSICDAVEAASRTLKKPEVSAIDNLVQRIVYGKLHLGQLDDSGLSMGDLRRLAESLRDTIRHANHGRIEYPWQKAQQDASASPPAVTQTGPRLDSLDRPARPDTVAAATPREPSAESSDSGDALSRTDEAGATPRLKAPARAGDDGELATVKYPKTDIDEIVELRQTRPSRPSGSDFPANPATSGSGDYAEMSAKYGTNPGPDLDPGESDPRLRSVTNPRMEAQRPSKEVIQFAHDAQQALNDASRDMPGTRPSAPATAASSADIQIVSQQILSEVPDVAQSRVPDSPAAVRKRAATLPPIKPLTMPPPIGRRSPTLPPSAALRPPTNTPPSMTIAPTSELRPPAPSKVVLPGMTAPPPLNVRPPGINYLDDMITLRPQYEARADLEISRGDDGSVRIEPSKAAPVDAADTAPNLELPLRAPASSPVIPVPRGGAPLADRRSIASRIDDQLDDGFGTETPVVAPTRAELQALLDSPPDVTRQQSYDELEELHRQTRDRPSQDLDLTRRAPYPTSEVDESDIEAAIELAPPARRHSIDSAAPSGAAARPGKPGLAIGVAKKPTKE